MNELLSIRATATANLSGRRSKGATLREFIRTQFRGEPTLAQVIFDITIGMVLPVLCLVFDPLVFRGGILGRPLAGSLQFVAYGFVAIEIVALAVWLGVGSRAGEWRGVLGGIMLAGALVSLVIGICLLPFSLLGLMLIIGALGFTPFITAFIYLRNARRALNAASAQLTRATLCITLLFGATLAVGTPAFAHWRVTKLVERSLAEVLGGNDVQADAAAHRLRHVGWLVTAELDEMVWAYGRSKDALQQERLARAYHKITNGGDIKQRWYVLTD
ncbi:MAG TPA: hypothetical protein VGB76_13605 [Pyrinomonadaceae bacterium]|jgi:hypothetical protein